MYVILRLIVNYHIFVAYRCVDYLVNHKALPMMRDRRGFTAFHYGVAGGNKMGLEHLLSAVSSIVCFHGSDMPKMTPLHLAVSYKFSSKTIFVYSLHSRCKDI